MSRLPITAARWGAAGAFVKSCLTLVAGLAASTLPGRGRLGGWLVSGGSRFVRQMLQEESCTPLRPSSCRAPARSRPPVRPSTAHGERHRLGDRRPGIARPGCCRSRTATCATACVGSASVTRPASMSTAVPSTHTCMPGACTGSCISLVPEGAAKGSQPNAVGPPHARPTPAHRAAGPGGCRHAGPLRRCSPPRSRCVRAVSA